MSKLLIENHTGKLNPHNGLIMILKVLIPLLWLEWDSLITQKMFEP